MKATMMDYPMTLGPLLERAGRLYGKVETVSRMPAPLGALLRCGAADV